MFKKYFHEVTVAFIAIFTSFNSKFPFEQEWHYQSSLKEEKLKSGLITTTVTAMVYVLFFVVDTWSVPSQLLTAGIVRCSFLFLSIFVIFLIIKKDAVFVKYYPLIMGCYYFCHTWRYILTTKHCLTCFYSTYYYNPACSFINSIAWPNKHFIPDHYEPTTIDIIGNSRGSLHGYQESLVKK